MCSLKNILILLTSVVAFSSYATAFFFSWGAPETSSQPPYFYYQRRLQGPNPSPYLTPSESQQMPMSIPAVPMQVPLQAQLSPMPPTVQNVQLVPCLCPVAQDYDYEKHQPQGETVYINSGGNSLGNLGNGLGSSAAQSYKQASMVGQQQQQQQASSRHV